VIGAIAGHEPVHLNVPNANYERIVRERLEAAGVGRRRVHLHHIATNECWTRDHGPAFVQRTHRGCRQTAVVDWGFNAWGGKYPPWDSDDAVPTRVAALLGLPVFKADIVMEGGAIDVNGAGTLLTTTSCLLHPNRNGGMPRADVERYLKAYYGQRHVVRPGLTGWAQVRHRYGSSVDDAQDKLQYDLFYIKHLSLAFDLYIVLETVKTVLVRRGS